jgi:hypothetical protein
VSNPRGLMSARKGAVHLGELRDLAFGVGETEPDDRYRSPKTAGRKPHCSLLTDAASPRR